MTSSGAWAVTSVIAPFFVIVVVRLVPSSDSVTKFVLTVVVPSVSSTRGWGVGGTAPKFPPGSIQMVDAGVANVIRGGWVAGFGFEGAPLWTRNQSWRASAFKGNLRGLPG